MPNNDLELKEKVYISIKWCVQSKDTIKSLEVRQNIGSIKD